MFGSIVGRFFCDVHDKLLKKPMADAIKSSPGNSQWIVVSRDPTKDLSQAQLVGDIFTDLALLDKTSRNVKIDSCWWIFSCNLTRNLSLLEIMTEKHEFWKFVIKPYVNTLECCVPSELTQCAIVIVIVKYLFDEPPKVKFNPQILKQDKYRDIVVSDQQGGLISCGKCVRTDCNPIWSINDCLMPGLNSHLASHSHNL